MAVSAVRRWMPVVGVFLMAGALALPGLAQEPSASEELAARTMLSEAERLYSLARPQDALQLVESLQATYPGTKAARSSEFKRAECLMLLDRQEEAQTIARRVVSENPATVLAAWAQAVLGESLVCQGSTKEGVLELLKVADMLEGIPDIGPVNSARGVLGRVFTKDLPYDFGTDPLQKMDELGLSRSEAEMNAQVLASVAVYRMKQDRLDIANFLADRIIHEYPDHQEIIDWTLAEIASMAALRMDKYGDAAADTLSRICDSGTPGSHQAAKACLALADYYERRGNRTKAIEVLQAARSKFMGTEADEQLLYELGTNLATNGKPADGAIVLNELVDKYPLSGYAPTALYMIGHYSALTDRATAVSALTKLAEGDYPLRWRASANARLGHVFTTTDKARARVYLSTSAQLYRQYLSEGIADMGVNWRDMINARIDSLNLQIEKIDK